VSPTPEQQQLCASLDVEPDTPDPESKLGVSAGVRAGELPVHGLRHPKGDGTNGWYLWTGELSDHDDFFAPLHWEHLAGCAPTVLRFLALPPGWRFLTDGVTEDMWFDATLLDV